MDHNQKLVMWRDLTGDTIRWDGDYGTQRPGHLDAREEIGEAVLELLCLPHQHQRRGRGAGTRLVRRGRRWGGGGKEIGGGGRVFPNPPPSSGGGGPAPRRPTKLLGDPSQPTQLLTFPARGCKMGKAAGPAPRPLGEHAFGGWALVRHLKVRKQGRGRCGGGSVPDHPPPWPMGKRNLPKPYKI